MNSQGTKGLFGRLQNFMASFRGKVILNYAYSWGAAIVILGALFKLTHLPGANMMLWIGMGTEVVVFFISAFDLPANKTETGTIYPPNMEIPREVTIPHGYPPQEGVSGRTETVTVVENKTEPHLQAPPVVAPPPAINLNSSQLDNATNNYLNQLKETTEMLSKLNRRMQGMFQDTDTDQLNSLNRSLSGITAMYDIQLKNLSSQIGTIDQVHEQIRKMARQIEELNSVYARMLEAMNANEK